MKIGIDLLWVRPGICGGTESVIRNLMNGFGRYGNEEEYLLMVTKDNADSFRQYEQYPNMTLQVCDVLCADRGRRILWENFHLDRAAAALGVDVMFIPVYSMPFTHGSGIPYVCVIHDLQAFHYPQYFSAGRKLFFRLMWRHTCKKARVVIAISEFCRRDLIAHYPFVEPRCRVIYNPIETTASSLPVQVLEEKYGVRPGEYFYCVSSMLPHKNLGTLLKVMELLKRKGWSRPLVLSGVGGDTQSFDAEVDRLGIREMVVNTGYVSDEERDALYENCSLFLFPSIFEGFGMPPVEAMRMGRQVVMTRESCLGEVTEGKAVYVEEPLNAQEWMEKIEYALQLVPRREAFAQYEPAQVTGEYLKMFREARG